MNNNNNSNRNSNNNNNRRRGRGNRQQGGGGGQQLNRIDSRARGNAPQLLEKYRKLAHDAHLNGDRVQAEYYLQFADHYFRVLADQRVRQDEQRGGRRDERWEGGQEESEENPEFAQDDNFPSYDQQSYQQRPAREERPRNFRPAQEDRDGPNREDSYNRGNDNGNRGNDSGNGEAETELESDDRATSASDEPVAESGSFEADENPFVRDNRGTRGLRPRREDRRPPRESRDDVPVSAGLDPSLLPPAITVGRDEPAVESADAKPRRGRPRKVVEAAPAEQD